MAYLPALRGGFTWADDLYVSDAPQLRSLSHLWETWASPGLHHGGAAGYLPLTYTAFWVQSHFWHTWPWGYHAVNVALHVLNAALVWRLLRRLQVPGSLLAALIFALHPVQVESVAWISQLKNLLSALFYLLSMACLLRFFGIKGSEDAHNEEHGHRRWYALAILSFLLAIGAGGIVFTLPAAVLLILWWKTGRIQPRDASILAPLFVIGVASGIFMARMKGLHFGIGGKEALEPFLLAGRGLWFYAGKLAWPSRLSFAYPRWNIDPLVWWQYLFPLSALAAVGALWRLRSDLGRGPLAAVLFFAGTLAPHLGSAGMSPEHYSCV
ncbi:MAG: O-GlcNAc transferase, partial [Elusimicrobia bacterium]|nr:O-GlcNAc transferase [Elusimicrobiota bacterium]